MSARRGWFVIYTWLAFKRLSKSFLTLENNQDLIIKATFKMVPVFLYRSNFYTGLTIKKNILSSNVTWSTVFILFTTMITLIPKSDNHEDTLHHQKRLTREPITSNFYPLCAFFSRENTRFHTAAMLILYTRVLLFCRHVFNYCMFIFIEGFEDRGWLLCCFN